MAAELLETYLFNSALTQHNHRAYDEVIDKAIGFFPNKAVLLHCGTQFFFLTGN